MGSAASKRRAHKSEQRARVARTAARWWRGRIEASTPDQLLSDGMFAPLELLIRDLHQIQKARVTKDQLDAFEDALADSVAGLLRADSRGLGVSLKTDYEPYEPLAAVVRAHDIPRDVIINKVWMHIELEHIRVSIGAADAAEVPLISAADSARARGA